jgi:hypothetical protein
MLPGGSSPLHAEPLLPFLLPDEVDLVERTAAVMADDLMRAVTSTWIRA